jgi:hypothetical protein
VTTEAVYLNQFTTIVSSSAVTEETVYREPIQKHNSTQSIITIFTVMKYALFIAVFILQLSLIAQKDTAFIYTFGGEKDEQGRDIELTSDNGFIMVGSTSSFGAGNSDIYLVKVDSNIKYEWSAAIGHEFTEFGHAVKQTADNGYIICGYTNSIGNGSYDAYLVRTDDKGKLLWEKTYGGFDWDFAYDIEITSDGGFLIVGETHSLGNGNADAYLIKTDKDGNLLWEKTMGGSGKDIAHALISTKDGNFAFCGENASKNPENKGDAWLVKFDGNGDTLFSGYVLLPEFESAKGIVETVSNGYAIVGISYSENIKTSDILTASFTDKGEFEWFFYHGAVYAPQIENDEGYGIDIYQNGNLLITGSSELGNGGDNVYSGMIRGNDGSYITAPSYGDSKNEAAFDCMILPKGGEAFLGTGESVSNGYSDMQLIIVDTVDGNKTLVYSKIEDTISTPVLNSTENNYAVNKTGVFPNPVINELFIQSDEEIFKIDVFSVNRTHISVPIFIDSGLSKIDTRTLPRGLYFIKIEFNEQVINRKFLKH